MYRLLLYYLIGLLLTAVCLSLFGDLHYKPLYIVISSLILVFACWIINRVFAYIFNAPISPESSIITGLILALIISPNPTGFGITFLLAVSGLAMASKYLLTINKKHIFNPAAIAVVLTALGPRQSASWWVGTTAMLPFVIIGGVLIVRKIKRGFMVTSFLLSTTLATSLYSVLGKTGVFTGLHDMVFSSAVFFLAFVMLTEPMTSPTNTNAQPWYAILVGALVPPQTHILRYYSSPEISLVIGNVFSYLVSPKVKLFPTLKQKVRTSVHSADFVFIPNRKIKYKPGQYMEWTLPHSKTDSRGDRRYLTLASSPTETDIRIGVKFYENGSTFKDALLNMSPQTPIVASQLTGNFVLPKDNSKKVVFIAGGIGITPFRSMVKYLIDKKDNRSVTLLYSARNEDELAYKPIFEEARKVIGLKTVYTLTGRNVQSHDSFTHAGPITAELIKATIPDYSERIFYISGTHTMVEAIQDILQDLGLYKHQIKTDFFPGYT